MDGSIWRNWIIMFYINLTLTNSMEYLVIYGFVNSKKCESALISAWIGIHKANFSRSKFIFLTGLEFFSTVPWRCGSNLTQINNDNYRDSDGDREKFSKILDRILNSDFLNKIYMKLKSRNVSEKERQKNSDRNSFAKRKIFAELLHEFSEEI